MTTTTTTFLFHERERKEAHWPQKPLDAGLEKLEQFGAILSGRKLPCSHAQRMDSGPRQDLNANGPGRLQAVTLLGREANLLLGLALSCTPMCWGRGCTSF